MQRTHWYTLMSPSGGLPIGKVVMELFQDAVPKVSLDITDRTP